MGQGPRYAAKAPLTGAERNGVLANKPYKKNSTGTDLLSVTSDQIDRKGWSKRPCKVINPSEIYILMDPL